MDPKDVPRNYVALDVETTGLEPESYILTAVGIGAPNSGVDVKVISDDDEEPELIRWIEEKLSEYDSNTVISFNAKFDFQYTRTRALIHGLQDPLRNQNMFDDLWWFKSFANFDKNGLDHIGAVLDIGGKVGKGHNMPRLYHEGKTKEIADHCERDVELLIGIHERILETETGVNPRPVYPDADNDPEDIPTIE